MNSSPTKKPTADPFASDIFADAKTKENYLESEIEPQTEIKEKAEWIWRLPKAARPAVDWNKLRRNLPVDFSDELPNQLAAALANQLNLADKDLIEFLFSDERETGGRSEYAGDSWWAKVGIETTEAEFAVEINGSFAVWLIDAMLGETVSDRRVQARDLTPSEIAVIEFLAVNLTHEANGIVSAPLFKLRSFSRRAPTWASPKNAENSFSRLVSTWQTVHGFQQSSVKIHLPPEALKALQIGENRLLTGAVRRAVTQRSLENRVKDVRTRLFLGATRVTLAEVAGFETGDVILIENYDFSVNRNGFYGSAEIFLSDGERVKIAGTFEPSEIEPPNESAEATVEQNDKSLVRRVKSNQLLQFSILYFEELENALFLEKSMPEDNANLTDDPIEGNSGGEASEGGVSLENLIVTLQIELEARRLSLAEVGNLRVNQIIQLGARPTDPVSLLIDNQIVARGELVEVEDQLGVRIVQLLR